MKVFAVLFGSLFVVKAIAGQTADDVVGRTWITDVTIWNRGAGENFAQIDEILCWEVWRRGYNPATLKKTVSPLHGDTVTCARRQ